MRIVTASDTLLPDDVDISFSSTSTIVFWLTASENRSRVVNFVNNGNGDVAITAVSGELIGTSRVLVLKKNDTLSIIEQDLLLWGILSHVVYSAFSNLLTFNQQIAIKKLSLNNQNKFDELCREVERTDLKDLLGAALLQDLQTNPTTANNELLLNGDTFTNYLGQTVKHQGIRYVLAYLNHSRYIGESFVQDTFSGMVRQNQNLSEPISEGTVKRLQATSKEIALSEFELIKQYLNENFTNYPLWMQAISTKPFTPKFGSIRKTAYGSDSEYRCPTTGKRIING